MADTLAHEAAADAHADDWTATPTPSKVFVFRR
jgi:hypothetical protein